MECTPNCEPRAKSTRPVRRVRRLELGRGPIAQTRVQALPIIDVLDEPPEIGFGLVERPIFVQVPLLVSIVRASCQPTQRREQASRTPARETKAAGQRLEVLSATPTRSGRAMATSTSRLGAVRRPCAAAVGTTKRRLRWHNSASCRSTRSTRWWLTAPPSRWRAGVTRR